MSYIAPNDPGPTGITSPRRWNTSSGNSVATSRPKFVMENGGLYSESCVTDENNGQLRAVNAAPTTNSFAAQALTDNSGHLPCHRSRCLAFRPSHREEFSEGTVRYSQHGPDRQLRRYAMSSKPSSPRKGDAKFAGMAEDSGKQGNSEVLVWDKTRDAMERENKEELRAKTGTAQTSWWLLPLSRCIGLLYSQTVNDAAAREKD
ncbi:hypothetical protein B0H17DRAFT_1146799 [Mycena rosella]|uniref:Uncharacterized protein n=1 Tax=Mycena rosella TaxID=1033263 RepID=A0AAD7CN31_MYCRO|nr:hypothetical protein B0H17DRAFT_1146799 [Mycena rosella]